MGLDPGTTTGFAVINTKGDILDHGSLKHAGLSQILTRVSIYGRVVVVATDKAKAPSFARHLSARFHARLYKPIEDLSKLDKKRILESIAVKTSNMHEADAIAAGLYCWKQFRKGFEKLKRFLSKVNINKDIEQELYAMLLKTDHWLVSKALMLEQSKAFDVEKQAKKSEKTLKPEKTVTTQHHNLNPFTKLLVRHLESIALENKKLLKKIDILKYKLKVLEQNIAKSKPVSDLISLEQKRIREFQHIISLKDNEIKELKASNHKLFGGLLGLARKTIIKYFKNPSLENVLKADIQDDDIVIIDSNKIPNRNVANQLLKARAVFINKRNLAYLKSLGVKAFNKELLQNLKTEHIILFDEFAILGCDYSILEKTLSKCLLIQELSAKYHLKKR